MESKSIILSSAGLKNLVPNANLAISEFRFIFGEKELCMNNVFADFISPTISRIHQSDPTISFIKVDSLFTDPSKLNEPFCINIFNDDIISLLKQLSSGNPIKIPNDQILNMQIISILLGNEELFEKISSLNSDENDQNSIDVQLQQIELFYYCSRSSNNLFDYKKTIESISGRLYSIDEEKLKKLPKPILYSILSSPHLRIKSEDWLFDFIQQIFNENESDSEIFNITSFYEQIDFLALSEAKFEEFLENFEFNEMTKTIWEKLSKCFYIYYYMAFGQKNKQRYAQEDSEVNDRNINFLNEKSVVNNFDQPKEKDDRNIGKSEVNDSTFVGNSVRLGYDGNNGFNGIINHFNNVTSDHITEKVTVTSSSRFIGNPLFVTELNDKLKYFMSLDRPDSWIQYEFVDSKVRPTHYSIRTWDNGKKGGHLKSWSIEVSNTGNDDDWRILDTRNEVTALDNNNAEVTFEIQSNLRENEFFKFVRLRQTDANVSGKNFLILSALEIFGSVIRNDQFINELLII